MRISVFRTAAVIAGVSIALISCSRSETTFYGYADGSFRYLASPVGGMLKQLHVRKGDIIAKDAALFSLDPQPEAHQVEAAKAQIEQADARYAQATADLQLAALTLRRQTDLVKKRSSSQEQLDTAKTHFEQAKAAQQLAKADQEAAQAHLAEISWTLQQKMQTAPTRGLIHDTFYRPGEYVTAGHGVVSFLAPEDRKAIFFIPQQQVGLIQLKQAVKIDCDSCRAPIDGKISFIATQVEYTPPVIYSDHMRDKLVFRAEARPTQPEQAVFLQPGQPLRVTVQFSDSKN